MRRRVLLPLAGFAAFSWSCVAQTPAAPDPSPSPSQNPSQTPAPTQPANQPPAPNPVQTIPGPTPSPSSFPGLPGYQAPSSSDPGIAPPAPAGKPVVTPATATAQQPVQAEPAYQPARMPDPYKKNHDGAVYIPVDSWVYPELTRLYNLGYADTMFLSLRPYTRQSLARILDATHDAVVNGGNEQAQEILARLETFVADEPIYANTPRGTLYGVETGYTRILGISGQSLRDSYHLGQTIVNDYGRPYEPGFNLLAGYSVLAERGRFSFYMRAEYQHSPSAAGYSQALSAALSQGANAANINTEYSQGDSILYTGYNLHQATIPTGPIAAVNPYRIQEATLSYHLLGHEISGGKSDVWQGPTVGGAMSWSNNAEDIYSFRINRIEPLHIPIFSRIFGPIRYDFIYGSLKGHSYPNHPYIHSEQASIRPFKDVEFTFQRTVIFGGAGHEPVTLHTFLRSFFSVSDTNAAEKAGPQDPGARFGDFSFSWRLPYLQKHLMLVADSIAHDDVSPISAPRRAAYRTGLYLSQVPGIPRLDIKVEAVSTDPGTTRSNGGQFNYFETIQRQGYTNKGFILGDWIGREAKGGDAFLTYHLSGDEFVQVEYLNKKNEKDFIPGAYNPATNTYGPGGTTQNSFKIEVEKRFHHDDVELNAWYQHEGWKAPIYLPGLNTDNAFAAQLTFWPKLRRTGNTQ